MYNKVEICGVNTSRLPVLSSSEKKELLKRTKQGDTDAREKLIDGNLRLVLSIIQRFAGRGGRRENLDDLFQVGCIGLIKAVDGFDMDKMVEFSTYAVPMIIGEIRRYLRDNNSIRVSRSVRDMAYRALSAKEKLSAENVTPDMLIELPKPVVPKTEPKQTVTAPTTLKQSAEPEAITETSETAKRKAAAEQVEKFFAARRARRQAQLDMLNATAINPKPEPSARTPQPTPTESKAPEKKEDPWKAIRGMGRANEIIADLEAGGVMSFSELSGFFFNTPHSDDHTTELADLRKKFTAIDTLIDKMKHRDELEPVYKEYQGKSGWAQSRFKKKNAATIEDYEQTVKYIKEHIKKYAVDGKPPTMLDLLEKSNKLKSKWNSLNVEHTAFLTKRETAKKYTRQARQYINEQQMKREREKSRQRTQAKHRNKNTLE